MKKTLILALALLVAIFCFTACDSDDDDALARVPTVEDDGTTKTYVVQSTEQFLALNNSDIQKEIMKGDDANVKFRLEADINLAGRNFDNGYAIYAITGEFDGNGHTITGSNNADYLFMYAVEDTTFKDFDVKFDSNSITKVLGEPLLYGKSGGKNWYYICDEESLSISFEDVDYDPDGKNYYDIGNNNTSLYLGTLNATCFVAICDPETGKVVGQTFLGGNIEKDKSATYKYKEGEEEKEKKVVYTTTLKNCEVEGNYTGGFGYSGAAIFYGGQLYGTTVNMENCEFKGNLVGYNVGLVVANATSCTTNGSDGGNHYDSIKVNATGVVNNGIIKYLSPNDSLEYGNKTKAQAASTYVTFSATGNGKMTLEPANIVKAKTGEEDVTSFYSSVGKEITFSCDKGARYEVMLMLPTVYWYSPEDTSEFARQTNSNTVTIPMDNLGDKKIYSPDYVASKADDLSSIEFEEEPLASGIFKEGNEYWFKRVKTGTNGGKIYLIIDYSETHPNYTMKYAKNDKALAAVTANNSNCIAIAYSKDGAIVGSSTLL